MHIASDIIKNINGVIIKLDSKLLYLDTDYDYIYDMNFITDKLLNDDSIILEIKTVFLPFNMITYFGSSSNLNCNQTRQLYNSMVHYYINLFLYKMESITQININEITNINNHYLCIVSECTSIIRSSIKKYVRNRTSKNEINCSKNKL